MGTELDRLRCIEAQIEEAISLHQSGGYEAIHLQDVLREGLVHCQLLRRMLEYVPFSDGDDYHCESCGESFDKYEAASGVCPMCGDRQNHWPQDRGEKRHGNERETCRCTQATSSDETTGKDTGNKGDSVQGNYCAPDFIV